MERPGQRQRLQLGLSEGVHLNVCLFFPIYSNKKIVKTLGFVLLINIYIFILPYNELAIAQGPKIHQKNEL